MRIKVRKKVLQKKSLSEPIVLGNDAQKEVGEFLNHCNQYRYSVPQLRTYLGQTFPVVFPSKPYPDNISMKMVELAIAYELQVRGYKRCGLAIPEKVLVNHKAALSYDTTKFETTMRSLLEINSKQQGEFTMKTAKAIPVRKAPKVNAETKAKENVAKKEKEKPVRVSVSGTYDALFARVVAGEKLTDAMIAAEMRKAFPNKKAYTEADVKSVRPLYNKGKDEAKKAKEYVAPVASAKAKKK